LISSGKRFDWDRARQTVEQATDALARGSRSEDHVERILRQRAERLAKGIAIPAAVEEEETLATFRVGESRFGIPLSDVGEVVAEAKIAMAPGTSSHIAGLIQVRGDVRVVVDIQVLLGLPAVRSDLNTVLFLRRDDRYLGLQVSEVEDIRTISRADRRAAPPEAQCAAWMADDLTVVLDAAAIFSRAIEES
jgi:chemotaxis signal transduction protein